MQTRSRGAPRAGVCITLRLPNEVLTEIIRNAPKADQATLCRVCKFFYALALPVLNREVVLRHEDLRVQQLEAFCSALIQSPVRADSVRTLTFTNGYSYSVRGEDLIVESLRIMRKLKHISIGDFRPHGGVISRLGSLTFPNLLSSFFIHAHPDSWKFDISRFLSRHPTITHLHLWYDAHGEVTHIPDGTLLPKLQCYHGPLPLLRYFSKRRLVAVRTAWTRRSSLVEQLATQTGPNLILEIDDLSGAQVLEVLICLSTHMWYLKKLKLRCWEGNSMTAADTVNQITAYLPRFESLAYIALSYDRPGLPVDIDEDKDRKALQVWANTCPTLRGSSIGEVAWRKVGDEWEECSTRVLDTEAGFVVLDEDL
ncbi:hypothetical protein FB45DRAFT_1095995 [Roridomyces roridus]|uniref:F-box domain-containing protein n=1 Tax=Roridomyces roridus TaxID=1738132 RepID=A0AAD7FER5_9AGAR|nr:hypothetical protein FB45DRAFT_1095995 [Roridomyces roridus]